MAFEDVRHTTLEGALDYDFITELLLRYIYFKNVLIRWHSTTKGFLCSL